MIRFVQMLGLGLVGLGGAIACAASEVADREHTTVGAAWWIVSLSLAVSGGIVLAIDRRRAKEGTDVSAKMWAIIPLLLAFASLLAILCELTLGG